MRCKGFGGEAKAGIGQGQEEGQAAGWESSMTGVEDGEGGAGRLCGWSMKGGREGRKGRTGTYIGY